MVAWLSMALHAVSSSIVAVVTLSLVVVTENKENIMAKVSDVKACEIFVYF